MVWPSGLTELTLQTRDSFSPGGEWKAFDGPVAPFGGLVKASVDSTNAQGYFMFQTSPGAYVLQQSVPAGFIKFAADTFTINADTQLRVTASCGIATLERSDDTPETLFKRADNALYAAKREGRNRVVADAA